MTTAAAPTADSPSNPPSRITSIDALRGLVMFTMIFVNDLASGGDVVPDWMSHFGDRHRTGSGMTFVDLVFPAFLFIVGMSIPFALGSRLNRGEPIGRIIGHVLARTLALLAIGILMVNGESGGTALWGYTMFLSCILAFCLISPRQAAADSAGFWKIFSGCLRLLGFAGMIYCAFTFSDHKGRHLITLSPFHIHTSWYGILGLIGWAYVVAATVFLIFRTHTTALLGCVALLLCFYPADRTGAFDHCWIANHIVSFADTLGSHAAIATAGVLLASILVMPDLRAHATRLRFTLLFSLGFAAAALLLNGLYGISKNEATPAWCLWACAITAALWAGAYYVCDLAKLQFMAKPLAVAGQNVLLAYLLSEMLPNPFHLLYFGHEQVLGWIIAFSLLWAFSLLCLTAALNRLGFRLKL